MKQTDWFLPYEKINMLLQKLQQQGYPCVGPQVYDGAIVYDDLDDAAQLPWGYETDQQLGHYRLKKTNSGRLFDWVNGPQAVKPKVFVPKESLWNVVRDAKGKLTFQSVVPDETLVKQTLFGIRPCDLKALLIQDKVFLDSQYQDARYKVRRENLWLIVANCVTSSNNCFCISAGGDTKADAHYDIAMTEVDNGVVVNAASERGAALLIDLSLTKASQAQLQQASKGLLDAANSQQKTLPTNNIKEKLMANHKHPQWDDVAERCLSCGNCTQVCPTCFCHSEQDKEELQQEQREHVREWDSCFTQGHSYVHGKAVRETTKQRYRQWLTHKLSTWHDQFGTSGCVGCGRCMTWCPAKIDMTEEAHKICAEPVKDKNND